MISKAPSLKYLLAALCLAGATAAPARVLWRQIDSSPEGILPTPPVGVEMTAALTLDVDGDSDEDFIIAGRRGAPAITLWRREANHWTSEVIESDKMRLEAGGAVHDIDGDGDLDILIGGDSSQRSIWWWENPHPNTGPWKRRLVKDGGGRQQHDQIFGDFDGDGKIELVAWNQKEAQALLRMQIPADPHTTEPWPVETIYHWTEGDSHEGLAKADIDGDGIDDIIGAGSWFRHEGNGKFSAHVIDPAMRFTRAAAGQLIEGGLPEVIFGPGDADGPLVMYRQSDDGWIPEVIEPMILHGHSLDIVDIDRDGHLDIFVAEMGNWGRQVTNPQARVMIFYGDGQGGFERQVVSAGQGVHEARIADLDGDGDLDILGKPFRHHAPRLVVWLNQGQSAAPLALDRWQRHRIDGPIEGKRLFVEAVDLDGDGLKDLVAGPAWHRNPGRIGDAWERRDIGAPFLNLAITHDFDGDGDIDLLGTTSGFRGNQFVVAYNDGSGNFTLRTDLPAGSGDFLQGVAAGRLQENRNIVALSWHKRANRLEGLVFPDDPAAPWELIELSPHTGKEQLSVDDLDRDADADLLLGFSWLRNDGGTWSHHPIGDVADLDPIGEADRNRLVDINGDGFRDAVVALENGIHVVWFEHPGEDPTQPWPRHVIGQAPGQGFSMDAADFDGDGDIDVIVGEHRNDDGNRVLLFENLDGQGGAWAEHVIDAGAPGELDHHDGTVAVDLDGDGDLDIATIGYHNSSIWVLENRAVDPR